MILAYRIVDWDRVHECAQSRKVDRLSWISVPNTHDSTGFICLLRRDDGVAVYGAYLLLAELSSRLPRGLRGWLISPTGEPLTAEYLSRRLGGGSQSWQTAIEVLSDPKHFVQWLVMEDIEPVLIAAGISLPASGTPVKPYRTGQDRTEPLPVLPAQSSLDENAGSERRTPTPTNPPRPAPSSDRAWVQKHVLLLASALQLSPDRELAQRRALARVCHDLLRLPDPDAGATYALQQAQAVLTDASVENPAACWQSRMNKFFKEQPNAQRAQRTDTKQPKQQRNGNGHALEA